MRTSKSTLTVARMALPAARDAVAEYAHPKSPKKFTQPQLLACLVAKEFLGLDYRGIRVLLGEWSDLRDVLGLRRVPHFTMLCAASARLHGCGPRHPLAANGDEDPAPRRGHASRHPSSLRHGPQRACAVCPHSQWRRR